MVDRRLTHVVAVAETGSFTRAAEKVGISQPGITRSIADLESQLGYALFFRTARGAVQTEAGRDFVDRATRLLEDARTLLAGDKEGKDPFAQVLRIGVCPASLEWLLTAPLVTLLKQHPTIRFEVVAATFERVVQLLRHGALEVAFGFEDAFAEWSEITREPIATLRAVPFVRRGHPLLAGDLASDLAQFPFVAPSDSRPYGAVIREIFETSGRSSLATQLHMIDYFPLVQRVVATSDAIGVTTEEYASSAAFDLKFNRVPGDSPFAPAPMCCAVRKRWEPPITVRAFMRIMRETMFLGHQP